MWRTLITDAGAMQQRGAETRGRTQGRVVFGFAWHPALGLMWGSHFLPCVILAAVSNALQASEGLALTASAAMHTLVYMVIRQLEDAGSTLGHFGGVTDEVLQVARFRDA